MIPSRARVVNEESPPIMRNYSSREEFFSLRYPKCVLRSFVEKFEAVNVIFYSAIILGRVREYIRHLCREQRELVSSCGR